jgi:hypothetical protein
MSLPLLDFLTRLATDPDFMRYFIEDPSGAMRKVGLPEEMAGLIRAGKVAEIEHAALDAIASAHSERGSEGSTRVRFSIDLPWPPPTSGPVSHFVICAGFMALVPLAPDRSGSLAMGPLVQFNVPTTPVAPMPTTASPAAPQQQERPAGQGPRIPPVPPMAPDH